MKKKLIGTIFFLGLALLMLCKLNDALAIKRSDGIQPMKRFYEQEEDSVDVIFYGSSHVYSNINPAVLWEEEGIASFDLAATMQPLWNTYYYIKESLKTQSPEVMVVELVRALETEDYIDEARTIVNTFGMKLSKNKIDNILASTDDNVLNYILCYPFYHSRYAELTRKDFADYLGDPNGGYSKGYYPLYDTEEFDSMPDLSGVTESGELTEKSEEYLRKIIELSREEDIELLFIVSPYQGISEEEEEIFNRCAEIAAEEGIAYIDFNQMYDELELDPGTDFAEASHLNYKGAEKYSSWLAEYLKENYDLEDHRGEPDYESWDKNAEDWEQKKANALLAEDEAWNSFLETLMTGGGTADAGGNEESGFTGSYTFVITLNGEYDNGEQPLVEFLEGIGIPAAMIEEGGAYISDRGSVSCYTAGAGGTVYLEFEGTDVKISLSSDGMVFECDGESQIRAENGINVFVYDNYTESIVTAVGFDADNGYSIVK